MDTIKAPFNFIPVSEKVFFPSWANQISHDIPFADGESGMIEFKIIAESPLFVRNGHTKDEAPESDKYKSFSKVDGRYFIPATTIKGAIRNVLEIMSFGKMIRVDDDSFGVRDLQNQVYRDIMKNQHCGWLEYTDKGYMLTDCGIPSRIAISAVDEKYKTRLEEFAKEPNNFKKDAGKTAEAKYTAIGKGFVLKSDFFEDDVLLEEKMKANNPVDPRHYVKFGGNEKGVLVLTGQPGARKKNAKTGKNEGKFYEFVFFNTDSAPILVDDKIIKAFKTVHKSSPDYTDFWGPKLNNGERIPVFFQYETIKEGAKEVVAIHSIGLSYLYKYPYKRSVWEAIPQNLKVEKDKPDLSDCIFGYIGKSNSLKGRVQFSAAFSENAEFDRDYKLILGSPKASYCPMYVRQQGRNGKVDKYQTYDNGTIAGWKRYLLRNSVWEHNENSKALDTVISPLKKGAIFTCKVRYHNLKKVELGALLSALSFHNNKACCHQIGQAKSYGFGRVKLDLQLSEAQQELINLFEDAVRKDIKSEWRNTEQIKELFTLASIPIRGDEDIFKYMKMSNIRDDNEFLKAKKEGLYLQKYSAIIGKSITPDSDLISLEQQLEDDYAALVDEARLLKNDGKYEEAKDKLAEADQIFSYRTEHDTLLTEITGMMERRAKEAEAERVREEQATKDKAKVESGLSFLEEKYPDGSKYKVVDFFKGAKPRIDQWLKKANLSALPPEQVPVLKITIDRLRQNPDKKEKKNWDDFNSAIWATIQSYVGNGIAEQWFEEK